MGEAIQTQCNNRTVAGTCRCLPKCKQCGWGPHMGIHLGCKDAPHVAYGHEYQPITKDGLVYFGTRDGDGGRDG